MTDDNDFEGRDDRTVFRPMGLQEAAPSASPAPRPSEARPSDERDDRTVFRPAPPRQAPPPAASPASPPVAEERDDRTVFRPAPRAAAPAPLEGQVEGGRLDDRTVFRPNPGGRRPPPPDRAAANLAGPPPVLAQPPREAAIQGSEIAATGQDPITRAAAPLLLLLGRLRAALLRAQAAQLTPQIVDAVQKFEADTIAAGVSAVDTASAKTLLCATADAILANLPGEESGLAAQTGLTSRFFGASDGPQRFLDEFARLKRDPYANHTLLILLHACLVLGFEGARIAFPAGAPTPEKLRQDVFAAIETGTTSADQAAAGRLSPNWEGQALASHAVRLTVPIWAVVGAVGLILFGLYFTMRAVLGYRAENVAQAMIAMNPATPVAIARSAVVPPPLPPPATRAQASQLERLRRILGPNIAAGMLDVQQTSSQIVVRITDRVSFQPGKTAVLEDFKPVMMYIAMALDDEKGQVKVTGHSDDRPATNSRYASTFELSLDRAKAVAALLKQSLSDPDRVDVEGKGADQPIAGNDTVEGRNKNRRVEIAIARGD